MASHYFRMDWAQGDKRIVDSPKSNSLLCQPEKWHWQGSKGYSARHLGERLCENHGHAARNGEVVVEVKALSRLLRSRSTPGNSRLFDLRSRIFFSHLRLSWLKTPLDSKKNLADRPIIFTACLQKKPKFEIQKRHFIFPVFHIHFHININVNIALRLPKLFPFAFRLNFITSSCLPYHAITQITMTDPAGPLAGLTVQDQKLIMGAFKSLKNGFEVSLPCRPPELLPMFPRKIALLLSVLDDSEMSWRATRSFCQSLS